MIKITRYSRIIYLYDVKIFDKIKTYTEIYLDTDTKTTHINTHMYIYRHIYIYTHIYLSYICICTYMRYVRDVYLLYMYVYIYMT